MTMRLKTQQLFKLLSQHSTIIAESFTNIGHEHSNQAATNLVRILVLGNLVEKLLPHLGLNLRNVLNCTNSELMAYALENYCQLANSLLHGKLFTFGIDLDLDKLPLEQIKPLYKTLQENPIALDPLTIAVVYERVLNSQNAKKDGVFYTPPILAHRMVSETISTYKHSQDDTKPELTALDPACGSGIFLLAAFDLLHSHYFGDNKPLLEDRVQLLRASLFAVDKDDSAVALARLLLTIKLYNGLPSRGLSNNPIPDLSSNIACGNALLQPNDFNLNDPAELALADKLQAFPWDAIFPTVHAKGGFNCIFGNPPYGLARGQQLSTIENERLKRVYHQTRTGKVNKYILFMARSYSLLHEQGVLSYIVPNAWLGIKAGRAIRQQLLKNQSLEAVEIFTKPIFSVPAVEAIVIRLTKQKKCKQIRISRFASTAEATPQSTLSVPISLCCRKPDYLIPTTWLPQCNQLFDHLDRYCFPLGAPDSPYIPAIALQAYAVGKGTPPQTRDDVKNHVFHNSKQIDNTYWRYLEGSDVKRYHLDWSGNWLSYGPWLADPQKPERFLFPRVLVREIISTLPYILTACYTEDPFLYNKSVLHILPKIEAKSEYSLALMVILNSSLASLVIHFRGRKSQRRLFPKIVNDDLRWFPLPCTLENHIGNLAKLGLRILRETNQTTRILHQQECDQAVCDAYSLNANLKKGLGQALIPQAI